MIPFLDLQLQHRPIASELARAAAQVIASGDFILGDHNLGFEKEFATFCGCQHAVTVSSGTAALHLALLAVGIGPGDEVITTASTFVATVAAIQYTGATVRLVDIDPETWTMDPARLEAALTPRTRAIVPVHLHGRLADMAAIMQIARGHGLVVIEDAAQAHGATADGRRAGTLGDLGCFSFYPGKNLGACGEGGAVTTDHPELAARIRRLRDWGQETKSLHVDKGFNLRLDEIQAALLRVKLPYLDRWTEMRRKAAARYDALLEEDGVVVPSPSPPGEHVYHVYAVRVDERDAVRARLSSSVGTNVHYPRPVHLQPAYADLGYRRGDLPHSERLAEETMSLPMYPGLTDEQIDAVRIALRNAHRAVLTPAVRGKAA